MSDEPMNDWPHLMALLDVGGHVTLGCIEPIQDVAIAANGREVFAVIKRGADENPVALLKRLEAALEHQALGGERINEVGLAMAIEEPRVRKRRRRA